MQFKNFSKIRTSIYFKLITIIIMSTLLSHLIVFIFSFILVRTNVYSFFYQYSDFYSFNLNSIIEKLGEDPDFNKARNISDELSIHIRYESQDKKWTTSDVIPSIEILKPYIVDNIKKFGKYKRNFFIILEKFDSCFIFFFPTTDINIEKIYLFIAIFSISFIFFGAYILIRILFRPIKHLLIGVNSIQNGDFNHQVPITTNDQLGDLIVSYNSMIKIIKTMLETKDRLLLDVSHELRSPITRMKVGIEFIKDKKIKQSLQEDLSEMESMIVEILETERLNSNYGKTRLGKNDLIKIIDDAKQDLSNKNIEIVLKKLPKSLFLLLDKERIRIVLRNIFENAIRYTQSDKGKIIITCREDFKHVYLEVKDFGIGIPENEIPNIFEPFYRVDQSRSKKTGGYGLGMYICKKIMEAHNGDISLSSKIGIGTTVTLKFNKL